MSKKFKIRGLKDLNKAIQQQTKNVEQAAKSQPVSMSELFDNGFMSKHTNGKFDTFEEFVVAKFPDTPFDKISDSEFDDWVNSQTDCSSWKEFQVEASKLNLTKRLGF